MKKLFIFQLLIISSLFQFAQSIQIQRNQFSISKFDKGLKSNSNLNSQFLITNDRNFFSSIHHPIYNQPSDLKSDLQNEVNRTDSIPKNKDKSVNIKNVSFSTSEAVLSINAYADFGYVFGPQKTHTYYDFITKQIVTDFGRRDFTSYPLYANSFALSYAFIQTQYAFQEKLKFKFALHTGHIVEALYTEEMNSLKLVREASLSYSFTDRITTEIGVFPSYYGAEIVLNKENFHATRAYIADFTPDYEAGIRTHFKVDSNLTLRLLVLNGWQEIKDLNGKKAIGLGFSYVKPNRYSLDWHLYFGDENPIGSILPHKYRFYSNLYSKVQLSKNYSILPVVDFMIQEPNQGKNTYDYVLAPAISLRRRLGNYFATAARYEHIYNADDIVPELKTNTPNGWQSNSYTLTFEYLPNPLLTFRIEGRYGWNKDAVFRNQNNELTRIDKYIILAMSFSL